jgi:glycine betaine/choline ABC-type transport system substrate-binding protein
MDRAKTFAVIALLSILGACSGGKRTITVGSKNFTEQVVLGEIIAQHLQNRLGQQVERRLNLGGTLLAHQALTSGEIELYPEYTGTALAAILKQPMTDMTPAAVLDRVRLTYSREFQIDWLDPLGIDNGFAIVVSGDDARRHKLQTLSDAARVPAPWTLGVGYEFEQRADGLGGLEKTYALRWTGPPKSMDLGLLYQALQQRQVSMIAANATDGLLSAMDVKVLSDDKHAFPPYEVCIAARQDALRVVPGLREALLELSGRFTNKRMQELNHAIDVLHRPEGDVAAEFLQQAGLK